MAKISKSDRRLIDSLVLGFNSEKDSLSTILENLRNDIVGSKSLRPHIHSLKWRVKDPEHLRDKMERKILEKKEAGKAFTVNPTNLFMRVNDLAGIRLLHLHTRQIEPINAGLLELFDEPQYRLIEGPTARTWDDESRAFFKKVGIKTIKSPSLYTSVHYVIKANKRTPYTCEIQVRTLMEEVWGEVDHSVNYPHATTSVACREQIAVLARVTSSCTRLVDAIFTSHADTLPEK
jgi:putative GTP pyrophosphokinase